MKVVTLPKVMVVGPSELPEGERWAAPCLAECCETMVQGGTAGMLAHSAVVHGQEDPKIRKTASSESVDDWRQRLYRLKHWREL